MNAFCIFLFYCAFVGFIILKRKEYNEEITNGVGQPGGRLTKEILRKAVDSLNRDKLVEHKLLPPFDEGREE